MWVRIAASLVFGSFLACCLAISRSAGLHSVVNAGGLLSVRVSWLEYSSSSTLLPKHNLLL